MKNSLRLLSVVLLLTVGAWCQSASISGSLTASGSSCASTNCVEFKPLQTNVPYGSAVITVSGTWSATLQFEASGDKGTTYVAINAFPLNSTTAVTSATANGSWQVNVAGVTNIRVRCSAFTSGPIVVTIQTSTASARSGGGGGSGGAVSSVTGAGTVSCSPTTGSVVCTGSGGASAGTTNDVQINLGGSFGVDTGVFTYTPSTHILNAGQGITTTSTGVATILGLSGGTTPGSFPPNSFGWLGPNNATFASYFFQCPTTPPTNGQTIVFGTQVGSVVPCTYATPVGGSGGVAFQLLVAVCQLTAGKSINGSFPAANAPTPDCVAGTSTTPQSGRALFSQISLAATPNQWVDQQFILPNPLTGTYSLVVKVQNDVVTAGTDYVSFQYVCAADTATALPTYASVQSFSVAVPGTANTYATITATPTVASCSAGNVLYTRLGVVSGSGSPTTNNLAIHSATLFVK